MNNLVLALPINEMYGLAIHDYSSSSNNGWGSGAASSPRPVWSNGGLQFTRNANESWIEFKNKSKLNGDLTFFAVIKFHDGTNINGICTDTTAGGVANAFGLEFGRTDYKLSFVWGNAVIGSSSTSLSLNKIYSVAATRENFGAYKKLTFYVNGVFDGSTNSVTAIVNSANNFSIGNHGLFATSLDFSGVIYCFYIWSKPLNLVEINNLHRSPYSMFTTPIMARPYLNFGSSGAPPAVTPIRKRSSIQISWWEQMMRNLGIG
ncbi:MAG: hypothetical protein HQK77_14175 [Desulfobacterales bacterium]|nr:hypothetical protein [Desulfobacterales bacterium]